MKYDWKRLENEFILSDYKSVSAFLKNKGIKATGNTNKQTKGWNEKRAKKEQEKSRKIIEKVTEEESKKEAQQIVDINMVAKKLLNKTSEAIEQLNLHVDMFGNKKESIIDRGDIKKLSSALKDLYDILKKEEGGKEENTTPQININIVDNSNLENELWGYNDENNK